MKLIIIKTELHHVVKIAVILIDINNDKDYNIKSRGVHREYRAQAVVTATTISVTSSPANSDGVCCVHASNANDAKK